MRWKPCESEAKYKESATAKEKSGLQELWRGLKARHLVLSRAESSRKRRSQKKNNQERFYKDPFQSAIQLFKQSRSGSFSVQKEQLEAHVKKIYSDPDRVIPLSEPTGLLWLAGPAEEINRKPPSLKEINAVVQKARAKSAPGPNGVPYLLYKTCPNVLKRLHKIFRGGWSNLKISEQWMSADEAYMPKKH